MESVQNVDCPWSVWTMALQMGCQVMTKGVDGERVFCNGQLSFEREKSKLNDDL